MWSLRVVTPPAVEPVTVDDAKQQCRIDAPDEDNLIAGYIVAARQYIESASGWAMMTQTLELGLRGFPEEDRIYLPRPPLQSVTSVLYTDVSQTTYTLPPTTGYLVDQYSEPAQIVLPFGQVWPSLILSTARPLVVQFIAGYTSAPLVPNPLKQAILMLVSHWYENREAVVVGHTSTIATELPMAVKSLLAPYTNFRNRY